MSVLWKRGKAALAVLLALGLACNGPDTRVFAEALGPTEQKANLSVELTDVGEMTPVTIDDIAQKLEASDGENVSDDAVTPDGGVTPGTADADAEEDGDVAGEEAPSENEDGAGEETPSEDEGVAGDEAPSEDGDTTGEETPSDSNDADGSSSDNEDADETDSSEETDEGEGSDESGDTEDGDDVAEPDGDEAESENPDDENLDEDSDAEDSDEGDEDEADDEVSEKDVIIGNDDALEADAEIEYGEGSILIGPIETSAIPWSLFSNRAAGDISLSSGSHVRWIDRLAIPSGYDYVMELYNYMAEASDGDGVDDVFINDELFANNNRKTLFTKNYSSEAEIKDALEEVTKYAVAVYGAFDRDFPEVFWLVGTFSTGYNWHRVGSSYETTFYVDFSKDRKSGWNQSKITSGISERDRQVQEICASVAGKDVYEKIVDFNDWLTSHNEYNTIIAANGNLDATNHMAWDCLSALKGNTGTEGPVCEGYARAFKVLCDNEGIPCVLVDGLGNGGAHMWNSVAVDGVWYAADVTWDDPGVLTGGSVGAVSGHENRNWLLVGAETVIGGKAFQESHIMENRPFSTGPSFINGPELSLTAYAPKPIPTVAFASNAQSVAYSGVQAAISAPTVTLESGATLDPSPVITYSYRVGNTGAYTNGLPVDVGTYEVKANVAGGNNYSAGESSNTLTLTITKAPLTIAAANQSIESGDSISVDVSKVTADKLLGSDKLTGCEISVVEGGYANVGTYGIAVKNAKIMRDGQDVTGNYEITYPEGTLTVTQATITDKTNKNQSIAEGDGKFVAPSFVDKNGKAIDGNITYTYGGTACSYDVLVSKLKDLKAGDNGAISYQFTPNSQNYKVPAQGTIDFTIVSISFTMNNEKATLENTVTVKKESPVYGDTWEQVLSLNSGLVAEFMGGQDADASHFALNVSGAIGQAGTVAYRVLYSGTISGTSFQNVTVCEGTVDVQKAPLTVTVNNHEIVYGDAPSNKGVSYNGFKFNDDASSLSGTLSYGYGGYSAQSKVGEYVLSASGLSSNNYDITYVPGKLIVAKRVIDVKWQGADKVTYDGAEHAITASVADASSIVNGDDVQITCTGNKGTSAGTYNAVAAVNNENYAISEGTRTKSFIIEPKKLAFLWSGDTKYTYDGKQHGIKAALDQNSLVSGDEVNFVCVDYQGVDAGEYTARVTSVSNPNYTVAGSETATMKWVIERRDIAGAKVALDETVLTYNAELQTKEVKSVILTVAGEEKTLVAGTEYVVEGATNTDAGNYTLTVTGIGNYVGSVTAAYTIERADKPVNKPTAEDAFVTTNAEDLSGVDLPNGWKWEDPDVELVPGGIVTVSITVENPDNYNITDANKEEFRAEYQVGKLPELVLDATDTSYTIGVGNGATIKSTGALKEFKEVKVDGNVVDESEYTLKEGSTILTFTKSYMDSLSIGKHTVEMFYTVGSVSVEMTVAKKDEPAINPGHFTPIVPAAPEAAPATVAATTTTTAANAAGVVLSPKTDQEDMMYVYWLIALAALAGAGACAKAAGRNRKSAR